MTPGTYKWRSRSILGSLLLHTHSRQPRPHCRRIPECRTALPSLAASDSLPPPHIGRYSHQLCRQSFPEMSQRQSTTAADHQAWEPVLLSCCSALSLASHGDASVPPYRVRDVVAAAGTGVSVGAGVASPPEPVILRGQRRPPPTNSTHSR